MGSAMSSLTVLKNALKHYEDKNFKKCIKICDDNMQLEDVSGDLLCLKGICLHSLGRINEGYELLRKGLQSSFRSGLGWHLYAIMLRNDKKYVEAAKALKSAIKFEPSNQGLQKELSMILMKLGDKSGFMNMRLDILSSSSTNFMNISAAAYSLILSREYLPYIFTTKSIIVLSDHTFYMPCILYFPYQSVYVDKIHISTKSTSYNFDFPHSAVVHKVEALCELNLIDDSLKILSDYISTSSSKDRFFEMLYLKVFAEKVIQNNAYFDGWISKLISIFNPDDHSSDCLVEKLISLQAWEYLNYLSQAYMFGGNNEKAATVYYKIICHLSESAGDNFEFGNYCFKRSNLSSCLLMQHFNQDIASSPILHQIIEGYLHSCIIPLLDKGEIKKDLIENLKNVYSYILLPSVKLLSRRIYFLLVFVFYYAELFELMKHYIVHSCARTFELIGNDHDDLLSTFIFEIYHQDLSINLYEFATIIPISTVERHLILFFQSAKKLIGNNPVVYAKSRRLIDLRLSDTTLKEKLLGSINI